MQPNPTCAVKVPFVFSRISSSVFLSLCFIHQLFLSNIVELSLSLSTLLEAPEALRSDWLLQPLSSLSANHSAESRCEARASVCRLRHIQSFSEQHQLVSSCWLCEKLADNDPVTGPT